MTDAPQDPLTPAEWQQAVDAAHALLVVDSARQYGLIRGGPAIDVGRCHQLLTDGAARGVRPSADALDRFVAEYLAEYAEQERPH